MQAQRTTWFKMKQGNLLIGNFGNDDDFPESVSCKGIEEEIEGSVIVKDNIKKNLVLDELVVHGNVKILGRIGGMIQANEMQVDGFTFLYKDNLGGDFVARNSTVKGIFFFKGSKPFWSIDLGNSKLEYVFFYEAM